MRLLSLFSGAGGLDLGFEKAGFDIVWANDFDKAVWETYKYNFPKTQLIQKSIKDIENKELPKNIDGVIGGPPCQSFSAAGKGRGVNDKRGQLFFEYLRIIKYLQPKFFLVENVSGMLHKKHGEAVENLLKEFDQANYNVTIYSVNASDFGVPEDRKRIFYVGFRKDLLSYPFNFDFEVPKFTLKDAIYDLKNNAVAGKTFNKKNDSLEIPNHEYMTGSFSYIFMSRNRVRAWNEPSFTIQAGGRHAPLHPQAPKMIPVEKDKKIFVPEKEYLYRRLSIRECARIQSFPDDFLFLYTSLADGYKMVGNAVPPLLSFYMANQFRSAFNLKVKPFRPSSWILPYSKKYKRTLSSKSPKKNRASTKINLVGSSS